MLTQKIQAQIQDAMKAQDVVRLNTLRMLSSAFSYEQIAKQHELSEAEELEVVKREYKKRKEAIEIYEKAGRTDKADTEKQELEILMTYLPAQLSADEVRAIVQAKIAEVGAASLADMGRVIGAVKSQVGNTADGAVISQLVKEELHV